MNPRRKIWVLAADEAIARLLRTGDDGGLVPLEELTDPAAHAKNAELRRDAHGRRGGTATTSAGLDATHQEAGEFARRVARRVAELVQQQSPDELRVTAAPRFLGLLRQAWPKAVAAIVTQELDKDLVHATETELASRFGIA